MCCLSMMTMMIMMTLRSTLSSTTGLGEALFCHLSQRLAHSHSLSPWLSTHLADTSAHVQQQQRQPSRSGSSRPRRGGSRGGTRSSRPQVCALPLYWVAMPAPALACQFTTLTHAHLSLHRGLVPDAAMSQCLQPPCTHTVCEVAQQALQAAHATLQVVAAQAAGGQPVHTQR